MTALVSQLALAWQTAQGAEQRLDFDASVRESFESTAEVTEHAVESGVAISDHVKQNADVLTIEAVVTNAPIVTPAHAADGATGSVQAVQLTVGNKRITVNVLQFSNVFDRRREVDRILRELKNTGQLLTVYTGLRTLENVIVERYGVERSAENGDALHLTLAVKQLRIASTQRVAAPRRVRRRQQRGPQPTAPAPLNSVLANLTGLGSR
jgi:hypothetical protein